MNKEFIPYKQALELKELGFNEECFGYYTLAEVRDYKNNGLDIRNEITLNTLNGYRKYDDESQTSAPLYQQAFRWFREKYEITYSIDGAKVYCKVSVDAQEYGEYGELDGAYNSYEKAELACLKKLIKIVKNK